MRPLCPEYSETFSYSRFPSREKIDLFRGLSYPFCSKNLDDSKRGGGALTWDEYEAQQKEEKKKTKVTAANPYWQKLIKF